MLTQQTVMKVLSSDLVKQIQIMNLTRHAEMGE